MCGDNETKSGYSWHVFFMMLCPPFKALLMKQLLLLITIHFIIFHQREKDKQDKVFVALQDKKVADTSPAKNWNFHFELQKNDLGKAFLGLTPAAYSLTSYKFLTAR